MLGWFVAECEVVRKRVNASKSEAMILTVKGGIPTLDELLPQVEYLRLLFMREGRLEHDIDRWISKVTTVLKTNVLKKKDYTLCGSLIVVSVLVQVP